MRSSIVWDNHACMPLRANDDFLPQLERFRKSGVDVVSLNVGFADMSQLEHIRILSFMRRWIARRPESYRLVSKVEDIHRCKAERKLGIVFDVEGMCPVQDEVSFVQTLYELGVRWMLIAYNRGNKAGGGCLDEDTGLADLGRGIIDEMERVGMVLCLSHAGPRTASEALEYSRNPPIFSHSNPSALVPHPRNVSDDLMRACARKGGVIGINGIGRFLAANHENLVERMLAHLRYAIDLVGPEHVGLSLDYVFDRQELAEYVRNNPKLFSGVVDAGAEAVPMVPPEAIPQIAEGLAKDGLRDREISGVLGENWLRVARAVWR